MEIFTVVGLVAVSVYTANISDTASAVSFLLVGGGAVWASFTGPRWFSAEPRIAWHLMASASLCFLIGVVIRPFIEHWPFPASQVDNLATIPGYLLMGAFLVRLLRSRQSIERHAVLDGLIVCVGAALASWVLLSAPAAAIESRPWLVSLLGGLYPFFDVATLLLLVNLSFTTGTWSPSLRALFGALLLMMVGDLSYAIIGVSGLLYYSRLLDTPFLLAFLLIGVTALHPSVPEVSRASRRPVQAWSWRRMLLIAPALAVPFALLVPVRGQSVPERLIIAGGGLVIVTLLLVRAVVAVRTQAAAQREAVHQATHDPLTGLPNRRRLAAEVERLLGTVPAQGASRVWACLLDLDRFKWVNESWGHDVGDQLVIELAARLRDRVPAGTLLARVGGDEFLLAFVADKPAALALVDQVTAWLREPLLLGDNQVVISASIGVADAAVDGDPAAAATSLLRDADTAMYRAKGEGPGRSMVFDPSMRGRVRERIELEAALRTALAEGEFRVAYQPIVDLATGAPIGAEALVRWERPGHGLVLPGLFIPIAEDTGLINELGTWVRGAALRQLGGWRADGTVGDDFYLSINVSPRQLRDAELPLVVSAELLLHAVPASAVALEITESVLADASAVTDQVLFDLRTLGVRLLVDDFGTGFSALGYLRRFPVTGVKIDRSFVSGLGDSTEDAAIVRAVVAMSAALGLSNVAEGVETQTQRTALAAMGVRQGQGWLWGRAVLAAEFATVWGPSGELAPAGSPGTPTVDGAS